jgi:hypothetical protein
MLSHSIQLLIKSKISLVQLEFETFNRFVTLTIVTYDFYSRFFSRVEFILGKNYLSCASSAAHTPNSSNHIVELRCQLELGEIFDWLADKNGT